MKSRVEMIVLILFCLMLITLFSKFDSLKKADTAIINNQTEFRKTYLSIQKTLDDRTARFDNIEKELKVL